MALKNISIVGGGLMGAGIAQIFALSGYGVKVLEPNADVRASIHSRTASNLEALGDDVSAVERIECLGCLLYTSPSPRDRTRSRMPSSA